MRPIVRNRPRTYAHLLGLWARLRGSRASDCDFPLAALRCLPTCNGGDLLYRLHPVVRGLFDAIRVCIDVLVACSGIPSIEFLTDFSRSVSNTRLQPRPRPKLVKDQGPRSSPPAKAR